MGKVFGANGSDNLSKTFSDLDLNKTHIRKNWVTILIVNSKRGFETEIPKLTILHVLVECQAVVAHEKKGT
jgi:hypothetical protein